MESEESDVEFDVAEAIGSGRRDKGKKDIVCNVCNRVYALNRCLNISGDSKNVSMRDKKCHAAVRKLERSAESRGKEAVASLFRMKKTKYDVYRRRVCAIRLSYPDDERCEWGEDETMVGTDAIISGSEIKDGRVVASRVWVEMDVKMLSKREFIGYAVGSLAMTVTDAEKYWVECSENAAIHREPAADGGILLATKMPNTYRGISCLEEYRDVVVAGETNDVGFARKSQLSMPDVLGSMATEFGVAALHAKKHVTAPTEYTKKNNMAASPDPMNVVGQQAPGSALALTQGAPSHDGKVTGKRTW